MYTYRKGYSTVHGLLTMTEKLGNLEITTKYRNCS